MQNSIPRFETERLILKAVTMEDIPAYQKNFSDYEVIRYLTSIVPWPYPENGVSEFLTRSIFPRQGQDLWLWGIFLKDCPEELIGTVQLLRQGKPEHRGFWLARKHWGKGLMTEAVEPVMNYAFDELGFEKLLFANAVGNVKSRRVKEKTGARLLYVKPAKFVDPAFTEHEIWELSKTAWKDFLTLRE